VLSELDRTLRLPKWFRNVDSILRLRRMASKEDNEIGEVIK